MGRSAIHTVVQRSGSDFDPDPDSDPDLEATVVVDAPLQSVPQRHTLRALSPVLAGWSGRLRTAQPMGRQHDTREGVAQRR